MTRQGRFFIVHINYLNNAGSNFSCTKGFIGGSGLGLKPAASLADLLHDELEVVNVRPGGQPPVKHEPQRGTELNVVINSLRVKGGGEVLEKARVAITLKAGGVGSHGEEVSQVKVAVMTKEVHATVVIDVIRAANHRTHVRSIAELGVVV